MKVYPRYIKSFWKKGVVQFLVVLSLGIFNACDFDIPDKFEMPIWELELKIPLVQTRYEMTDISNPDAGIFPTDDSLGFKIVQEGTMPATELDSLPAVPVGLDQNISSGEIPGLSFNLDLPAISVNQKIDVVLKLSVSLGTIKKRISERQNQENRTDDSEDIAIKRFQTYDQSTKPVLEYYKKQKLIKEVNGEQKIEEINKEIGDIIDLIEA